MDIVLNSLQIFVFIISVVIKSLLNNCTAGQICVTVHVVLESCAMGCAQALTVCRIYYRFSFPTRQTSRWQTLNQSHELYRLTSQEKELEL